MVVLPRRFTRVAFALLAFFGLTATQCSQSVTTPPGQWSVVNTLVNANTPDVRPGDPRTTVFFSQNLWQETNPRAANFASGWMNDVLVKGRFAFQIEVRGAQLFSGGLIVRDVASGQDLTARQARVNASRNCGPMQPSGTPGQPPQPSATIQCYLDPGSANFRARPDLPANETSVTVELVQVCRGQPRYTDLRCPEQPFGDPDGAQAPTDAILLLTISPPTAPALPSHGQKFEYDLVSRTSAGETKTRLTAVYVDRGKCNLTSLQAVPAKGSVGATTTVQWFAQDCRSIEVTTSDPSAPVLFTQIAPGTDASLPSLNGSRTYQLGSELLEVRFTAKVHDSMGAPGGQRTVGVDVEPCSISKTHPRCESRCQVTPAPAGCAQPPQPVCAVGEGDANRQRKNFPVTALCIYGPQWSETKDRTEAACTLDEARQSVLAQLGPNCTIATGAPVARACPNGAAERDWKFCLQCAGTVTSSAPVSHDSTAKACYLPDAVEKAKLNYPNSICWLQQEGACPK